MALVNVAAELVRWGRKVLVVDFDIEAPGLETYKLLRPKKPHPGIVEYVTEYMKSAVEVPDIRKFVYKADVPIGKQEGDQTKGELYVMPAGRRDAAYRRALVSLNWKRLYAERGGYYFFEETKKAWESAWADEDFKPDYVLIDSRTGDTDVLGICTRQLPDSVVLMFALNKQNLAGLKNVCDDIRREEQEGLKKKIRLHFVAANVPNLDDEDDFLRDQIKTFKKNLEFRRLSVVIRRYESLKLLDQSVVVLDCPGSRLARSYKKLTEKLVKDNFADRTGVMLSLQDAAYSPNPRTDSLLELTIDRTLEQLVQQGYIAKGLSTTLSKVSENFLDDAEVLEMVAKCWMSQDDYKQAERVLKRVLALSPNRSAALFLRAQCKRHLLRLDEAAEDFLAYLRSPERQISEIKHALQALTDVKPQKLGEAADIVAAAEPSEEFETYVDVLCKSEIGIPHAARLLQRLVANLNTEQRQAEPNKLFEYLFRARCWRELIELYGEQKIEELSYDYLFFLACAQWGLTGDLPENVCRQALEHGDDIVEIIKIWLLWGARLVPDALKVLDELERVAQGCSQFGEQFSAWSLRRVSKEQLLVDLAMVRRMFQGEPLRPAFLGPTTE